MDKIEREIEMAKKAFLPGDINPGNVRLQDDDLIFTDMETAGYGHPCVDPAVNCPAFVHSDNDNLILKAGLSPEEAIPLFNKFLKGYFDTEDQELIEQYKKRSFR